MERQHILGIAGSLRIASLNRRLLNAAVTLRPERMIIGLYSGLADIPVFNEDLEAGEHIPSAVGGVRELARGADGILVATPEYNQSLPGALKNLVDWLSRGDNVLERKPVALVGATTGPWGTRYAQKELRHVLAATGSYVMPQPMLFLAHAEDVLDPSGALTSPNTAHRLAQLLEAFGDWIDLVSERSAPTLSSRT